MAEAPRDQNHVPSALGVSSSDSTVTIPFKVDPITGRLLTDSAAGSGTVSSVSVVSANGFAGTVATATTTPAITLSTTVTGVLKGNGTVISAATNADLPVMTATVGGAVPTPPNNTTTFLRGDGTFATPASGGSPGGLNAQLQYNNSGAFGGITNATTDGTSVSLTTPHFLNPTINGAGAGLATLAYPNTASNVTVTLPIATDTLVGKATTDTLTNKTFNTAATGNVFQINGVGITAVNGTGAVALTTSPAFVTPTLGAALATSINGNVFTTGSSTYTGTAAATYTFPGASATIAGLATTQTFTNKTITRRLVTVNAPGATPSTNTDNVDIANFTGLATAITSMSTNLTGTRVDGQLVEYRFTDNGTPQTIAWGASFGATTVALPTTTVASTMLRALFEYNGTILQCIAVA